MKTREDVWNFMCENGYAKFFINYYVKPFPDTYKVFWGTMLMALEMCGKITIEDSWNIWNEVREAEED